MAGLAILLCIAFDAVSAQDDPAAPVSAQKTAPVQPKPSAHPGPQSKTPRLIAVDLIIAEVGPRKAEGAKSGPLEKQFDARDLSGSMNEVLAKVEALKKTGQIGYFRRIQLSTAEGQQASVSIGEMRPTVTGVNTSAAGHISRSITYVNTGTNVKITAQVSPDGQVLMDLNVEDARGRMSGDGVPIGTDENGQPIRAEERIMAKVTTKLSVASGHSRAAEVVTTSSRSEQAQTLVIAGARIAEP
jgi:type II secretory pathway component GspD/PulD (secretin)